VFLFSLLRSPCCSTQKLRMSRHKDLLLPISVRRCVCFFLLHFLLAELTARLNSDWKPPFSPTGLPPPHPPVFDYGWDFSIFCFFWGRSSRFNLSLFLPFCLTLWSPRAVPPAPQALPLTPPPAPFRPWPFGGHSLVPVQPSRFFASSSDVLWN